MSMRFSRGSNDSKPALPSSVQASCGGHGCAPRGFDSVCRSKATQAIAAEAFELGDQSEVRATESPAHGGGKAAAKLRCEQCGQTTTCPPTCESGGGKPGVSSPGQRAATVAQGAGTRKLRPPSPRTVRRRLEGSFRSRGNRKQSAERTGHFHSATGRLALKSCRR
jgi:hypothetical protein